MHKLLALALVAAALAVLAVPVRADVTWTFYETACTVFSSGAPCHFPDAPPPPAVLAILSLPGPTSSGSADWELFTTPVYTGDRFEFGFVGGSITPAFTGTPNCESFPFTINSLCEFHIAWSEVDGHLDAISIYVLGAENQIGAVGRPFGLNGGIIASDFVIGSCELTQCIATGFWQSNLVPEPGSAALLASGLLGLWMTRRRRAGAARAMRSAAAAGLREALPQA
jgi:hypothetical protein